MAGMIVAQARESLPPVAWVRLQTTTAHAATSRLAVPRNFILDTLCGRGGFAEDAEDTDSCCRTCLASLSGADEEKT